MVKTKNLRKNKNSLYNAVGRKMPTISQSVRDSRQCRSKTVKKARCRKRTAHTNKCWIHLAKEDNLRIKKSGIRNAGEGLYSWKKPFRRNEDIILYSRKRTNMRKMDNKYGAKTIAQYALCEGPDDCIDAYKTTHTAARYANDAKGSNFSNNSHFKGRTQTTPHFKLHSNKPIRLHQEIFADYGAEYWPRGYFSKK